MKFIWSSYLDNNWSLIMNIVILGPQGSGKGTQAELLATKYKLVHIEMGEFLREVSSQKTVFGRKVNLIINKKKELVPDGIIKKILAQRVKKIPKSKGIIFDGIPRKLSQIKLINKIIGSLGRKIGKVIFVKISARESIKRISKRYHCMNCETGLILGRDIKSPKSKCPVCAGLVGQRVDDTIFGIKKRLAIFCRETLPVIRYYKRKKILIEINGEQPINNIFEQIVKKLDDQY